MNTRAEFEQEKDGRWVATFPGVRGAVGYGSTRHEAAVGLTVSALHVLADRVESGDLKVQDEPVRILLSAAEDQLAGVLVGLVLGLESGHTPNAETIAAIEELERWWVRVSEVEELMAELNADD
jgi:predicted RNase H-like HicB family nuclease